MRYKAILTLVILFVLSAGCSSAEIPPTPDLDATIEVALEQTLEAMPTSTPITTPTHTPTQTYTPTSTNTPSKTPTATATVEEKSYSISKEDNGGTTYIYHEDGFKFTLPSLWIHFDLTSDDLEEMIAAASEANPVVGSIFTTSYMRNLAATGIKFLAVDVSKESTSAGIPNSFNILRTELSIEIELDAFVALNIQQLKNIFGLDTTVAEDRVQIGSIEAAKLTYEIVQNDILGQPQDVVIRQYLIFDEKDVIVITFGSDKENYDKSSITFATIAHTFELID
jgi:hypothetical protein